MRRQKNVCAVPAHLSARAQDAGTKAMSAKLRAILSAQILPACLASIVQRQKLSTDR